MVCKFIFQACLSLAEVELGGGGGEVLPQGSEGGGKHGILALPLLGERCTHLTGVLGWYVCFI